VDEAMVCVREGDAVRHDDFFDYWTREQPAADS
jgi:hypothetical protein